MTQPVLVRLWSKNFEHRGWIETPFDNGFFVPRDHPIAAPLWELPENLHMLITVEATEEFCWRIHEVSRAPWMTNIEVRYTPWVEGLRRTIVSDEWFLAHPHLFPQGGKQ